MADIWEFFSNLFGTDGFPARWMCGSGWTPFLGYLHICSDVAIFAAYAAIPFTLALFLFRRRDIPFPGTGWLFVAFILSCGITHIIDAIIFYQPIYRFGGLIKFITALASWATVVALVRLMPAVMRVPSIQAENRQLHTALIDTQLQAGSISRERSKLEKRASGLTLRDHRMQRALEASLVVCIQWEQGARRILWSVGAGEVFEQVGLDGREWLDWSRILDEPGLLSLRQAEIAAEHKHRIDLTLVLRDGAKSRQVRIVGAAEPPIKDQQRTYTGMMRFIDATAS